MNTKRHDAYKIKSLILARLVDSSFFPSYERFNPIVIWSIVQI